MIRNEKINDPHGNGNKILDLFSKITDLQKNLTHPCSKSVGRATVASQKKTSKKGHYVGKAREKQYKKPFHFR